jgi:hypothetical protein
MAEELFVGLLALAGIFVVILYLAWRLLSEYINGEGL